jgi:beta-lactam-binding protein with PASTA domain
VFSFITNKPFWVNLLVAVVLTFAIFFGILQLLGVITNHGEYLKVPSVMGKNTNEAIKYLEDKGFDVVIQDSVYTDTAKMGIVLKQLPDPNSTVKINRTILLTVNRITLPLIDMPALEGKTLNFALEILRRSHLKLGDTIFQPDFMKGSVISQQFRRDKIAPGSKLPWGSAVDLVVGSGLNEEPIPVPDLSGLTYEEAKILLEEQGILLGAVFPDPDVTDTLSAFVWKQIPPVKNEQKEIIFIKPGQLIDLWLSLQRKLPEDSLNLNQP